MKDTKLIIGLKNTGKTRNYLFKEVNRSIERNENLLIYNTRDEYFKTYSKKLKDNNYNVLVLNLNDVDASNGFNPLMLPYGLYKSGNSDEAFILLNDLAHEIFKSESRSVDPFWENSAASFFVGLALVLFKEGSENEINLGSIHAMARSGEEKLDDSTYARKYLAEFNKNDTIYALLSPIVYAPTETRGSILSVFKQKLMLYLSREKLLNLLCTSDINILDLKIKTAIIIIADRTPDIANILINQVINESKLKFTYILDNFDKLRHVCLFNNLLDNATYNSNKVYVAIHDEESFKEKYGRSVMNSFDEVIHTEISDNPSLEEIGECNDYPSLELVNHDYFDLRKIINK